MIHDMLAILKKYDLTLSDLLDLTKTLLNRGLPPSVDDKPALREWLRGMIPVLGDIARRTPIAWDDSIVEFWQEVISSDDNWDLAYGLLHMVYERFQSDAKTLAVHPGEKGHLNAVKARVGMDWDTIMDAVRLIVELLELLRGRN